ncbi:hypothetical protein Cs7R123_25470 [Catellatospora sp. TT07R-123]|uniref:hypothetical protein n=1 Tax=Catellatospora sp. TT07R-123 TaxID=2733863 RepID=UPI001B0C50E8|nr:hypothetical protein [Catellatospora sp. TT07R-123]GHJ45205.1 hypothetical protein Cs7R123_25470 [Catellatospora sp. TT07R-123]
MDVVFANLLLGLSHAALIWLGLAVAAALAAIALAAYHRVTVDRDDDVPTSRATAHRDAFAPHRTAYGVATGRDGDARGSAAFVRRGVTAVRDSAVPAVARPLRRLGELLRAAFTGAVAVEPEPVPAGPSTGQLLAAHTRTLQQRAKEAGLAADRAAAVAGRRRDEWLAAQDAAERAWHEFDAADTDARRVLAARAIPLPRTPQTPAEYAFRERFLHRNAMSASAHNRLSALELSDALAHRAGWDPRRHPIEQEAELCRAARQSLRDEYGRAAAREKTAWLASEAAAAAADSLRRAADAAGNRARWAQRRTAPATAAPALDQTMVLPVIQAAANRSR